MGSPAPEKAARYAVAGPKGNAPVELAPEEEAKKPADAPGSPPAVQAAAAPAPAQRAAAASVPLAGAARNDAVAEARQFGMIGALDKSAPAAARPMPVATAAASAASPAPDSAPLGHDDSIGDAFGAGWLGLSGIGAGGGGKPAGGVGLADIGRGASSGEGFGSGHGRLGGEHASSGLKLRTRVVRASELNISIGIGDLPRALLGCSGAANVPLGDRVLLWRERLQRTGGDPDQVAGVYRRALSDCEAPTWRERSRLLALLLDASPSVTSQVRLWRVMFHDLGANDAIYRGILGRVHTPAQMRELHEALGLKAVDPGLLARAIQNAKSPGERVATLRAMSAEWPDDFSAALALLDALEDAGDTVGARAEARLLRLRPDADAHLRTAVGELYLRLAARAKGDPEKTDLSAEARRAFGEIVEFSPEDPVARRRLGELLCAHGWFADARRQYETLQTLAPDDPNVSLLLASAAEGQGLLEEALKWAEKGSTVNAPDSIATIAARALEATYLAWGRQAARSAQRGKELDALITRATRVLASVGTDAGDAHGVRVSLTWLHPEFHPNLWSNALGAPMPASEGDPLLGVAQVKVPDRPGSFVEVRLEPSEVERMARLGAEAHLTAVFDELGEHERIVDIPVRFQRGGPSSQRFSLANGEVRHD
jgi:Ca-activated chloride channel family protein